MAKKKNNDEVSSRVSSMSEAEQEMRYMKASPIADCVEILDQLGISSPGYRHYCELTGISGTDDHVTGPYSGREVAYYEVKCYQVTRTAYGTEETLLAHERSLSPFFFKDGSCDTKVYVDMQSFGNDVLLINSVDRMEGPDSDFAKQARNLTSSSTKPFGYAAVANPQSRGTVKDSIAGGVLSDIARSVQSVLDPGHAFSSFKPALAGATAGMSGSYGMGSDDWDQHDANMKFAYGRRPSGPGFGGPGRPGSGGFGGHRPSSPGRMGNSGFGTFGNAGPMGGLGGNNDIGDLIGGLVVGGMLASLLSQSNAADSIDPETFLGYRLVENVIPLNQAVFALGEIYRTGDRVYIGRGTGSDVKASYFSARPEEEMIAKMKQPAQAASGSSRMGGKGGTIGCASVAVVVVIGLLVYFLMFGGWGYY